MGNNFNTSPPSLPKNDVNPRGRQERLVSVRQKYQLEQKRFGLMKHIDQRKEKDDSVDLVNIPPMLKKLPYEENWTVRAWLKFLFRYLLFLIHQLIYGRKHWTVQRLIDHMSSSRILQEPKGCEVWRTEHINAQNELPDPLKRKQADHWFAWQRLNGVTRNLISRTTDIPPSFKNFVDTIQTDHPYLGEQNLKEHMENKGLFVVDLAEVAFENRKLLAPIALFVVQNEILMPVAIRLLPNNPKNEKNTADLFLPMRLEIEANSENLQKWKNWNKAKMWFNMLEAQFHESITHLGFTHLLMDGVSVCLHRNISERHPVYKPMVPHFRFMHRINKLARKELLKPGGYVDKDMYFTSKDMLHLISRRNTKWKLNHHGTLCQDIENRGVKDLPGYSFRDDALAIRNAIKGYVNEYITHYYGNNETVKEDTEIKAFHYELTAQRSMDPGGGCGMQGVPLFDSIPNLVQVLTNFIYICSVEHSATNFPQYEQYGFLPNFPATLKGQPELQNGLNVIDWALPNARKIFSTVKIMKVLTTVLTNSLGNYESSYLKEMDENGRNIVSNFQQALDEIRTKINLRNTDIMRQNMENGNEVQKYPYKWLLPESVLNSISI